MLQAMAGWLRLPQADTERAWRGVLYTDPDDSEDATSEADGNGQRQEAPGGAFEPPVAPPDLATYSASLLGVKVAASPQELTRAYRQKARQYHPDVVAHRGPEFARKAEERFKELSMAYQFLRGSAAAN